MRINIVACALLCCALQVSAQDFSYRNLLLANLKLSVENNSPAATEYYLRVVDYPRFIKAISTESLPQTIKIAQEELGKTLEEFDEKEPFDITLTMQVRSFEQSKNSFELELTPSTELLPNERPEPTHASKKLYVVLTNTFSINEVTLPPAAMAKILSDAGHVIQLRLRVKLTKGFSNGKCKGEVIKIEVLSRDGSELYLSTTV